ncbi:MAG TPA: site-2 protease family protein [bacterium]|nr:site-2 protease family protein [bacterium]
MFRKQLTIFHVGEIPIRLDLSWFLILLLFSWSLATHFFPLEYRGLHTSTYWFMGIAAALLLFTSVLLHELGHSLVGRHFGIKIRGITLFIFGGVADMAEEPYSPKAEFLMAVAGPLVSAVLAVVFWLIAKGVVLFRLPLVFYGIAEYLSLANTFLLIFNLLPGFPLDGGRVVRAALWKAMGSLTRSTRIASAIGRGLGITIALLGLVSLFFGGQISGIWLVLIGLFLRRAAEASYQNLYIRSGLEGLRIKDFMTPRLVSIPAEISLAVAVQEFFLRHPYHIYPVVQEGHVVGFIEDKIVKTISSDQWQAKSVLDVTTTDPFKSAVNPDDDAVKALVTMAQNGVGRVPVVSEGQLVGIISRRDIMEMIRIRMALTK